MPVDEKCPVCGSGHGRAEPTRITQADCRKIPDGYVWIDRSFDKGPPGVLMQVNKSGAK